jgi:predicted dehydrogenase
MTTRQTRSWKLLPPFRQDGDRGWIARLPDELHALTDAPDAPLASRLGLRENGTLLGPAHSLHNAIRSAGSGRYSFWGKALYFSTSDASDPNANGRSYVIELAAQGQVQPEIATGERSREWRRPVRAIRCAVYGLGNRGVWLGRLAAKFPGIEIAWLVDRSMERLTDVRQKIWPQAAVTTDILEPLGDPELDAVIVAVPDHLHRAVAEPAFLARKHVFLEKPVATTVEDARAIVAAWLDSERILQLGYVLRQAPFYAAIGEIVRAGTLGAVRTAELSEQIDVMRGASFMRRWHSNSSQSGGLIVHKGCHDLDLICWLLDAAPRVVGSLGGLSTFAQPAPADFCSRCSRARSCPYVDSAWSERRTTREAADPTSYGLDRCVFHPDKDIVDNQVVMFELDTGTRGTFHMSMQGPRRSERRIRLVGDAATLDGVFEDGRFAVTFVDRNVAPFNWAMEGRPADGHGGGDHVTMFDFLDACAGRSPRPIDSAIDILRGLVFAVTAEASRRKGTVVTLTDADFRLAAQPPATSAAREGRRANGL